MKKLVILSMLIFSTSIIYAGGDWSKTGYILELEVLDPGVHGSDMIRFVPDFGWGEGNNPVLYIGETENPNAMLSILLTAMTTVKKVHILTENYDVKHIRMTKDE